MVRLGIAAESPREAETTAGLGDKIIVELATWADGQLDVVRAWSGPYGAPWLRIGVATKEATRRGVRTFGHFQDGPGVPEAQLYRNVFALFADDAEAFDVVVVARDTDGDRARLEGFDQAARDRQWGFVPVHAWGNPEFEAWLLAAFVPETETERARLAQLKKELGFDPTVSADRLSSGRKTGKRDAKRILEHLVSDKDALARLGRVSLDQLRERGGRSGLADFLAALRAALAPRLGSGPP